MAILVAILYDLNTKYGVPLGRFLIVPRTDTAQHIQNYFLSRPGRPQHQTTHQYSKHVQRSAGKKRPVTADSPDSEGDSNIFDLSAAAAVVVVVVLVVLKSPIKSPARPCSPSPTPSRLSSLSPLYPPKDHETRSRNHRQHPLLPLPVLQTQRQKYQTAPIGGLYQPSSCHLLPLSLILLISSALLAVSAG